VWVRRLFFILALLYILPFWVVEYIPTTDGPCHTYNAWVHRQHGNVEEYPLFNSHYEIDPRPLPNWITHGTLTLLMLAVPPLLAEKILVSGYVLLFLAGAWYFVGSVRPTERWPAFLAFPFVYNQLFQFGFYNFSISLGLFFFAVGFWWRHRDGFGLGAAVTLNLLLWLCWFSHILSFMLALFSIGVLWLVTLERDRLRRHLWQIPALGPQIFLPIWFFAAQGTATVGSASSFADLFRNFNSLLVLFTFSVVQIHGARLLALLFLVLTVLTVLRRRPLRVVKEDGFLLLSLLFVALYYLSPEGMSGGSILKPRLSLYPFLILLPWLSPWRGRLAPAVSAAALALVAALNLGYLVHWYRLLDVEMRQYARGLEAIRPNSRVLPLLFEHSGSADLTSIFGHTFSYVALEKGLVDWDNYSATTSLFPVRFRRSVHRPNVWHIEATPHEFPLRQYLDQVDYVYTWKMPPGLVVARRLRSGYDLIWEKDGGALWQRKPPRAKRVQSPHAQPARRGERLRAGA